MLRRKWSRQDVCHEGVHGVPIGPTNTTRTCHFTLTALPPTDLTVIDVYWILELLFHSFRLGEMDAIQISIFNARPRCRAPGNIYCSHPSETCMRCSQHSLGLGEILSGGRPHAIDIGLGSSRQSCSISIPSQVHGPERPSGTRGGHGI